MEILIIGQHTSLTIQFGVQPVLVQKQTTATATTTQKQTKIKTAHK